jgi:hypothetical protein
MESLARRYGIPYLRLFARQSEATVELFKGHRVGVRPHAQTEDYVGTVPQETLVPVPRETIVSVRVNAFRPPIERHGLGASDIPFDEMTKLDYLYATNWSPRENLSLGLLKLPALARAKASY